MSQATSDKHYFGMTKKQSRFYDAFVEFIDLYGESPTYRELGDRMDMSSSGVHRFINALVDKGFFMKEEGARGIKLTDKEVKEYE